MKKLLAKVAQASRLWSSAGRPSGSPLLLATLTILALLLPGVAQAAPVQFGTSGDAYNLGARNLVRTSGGVLYAVVLNATAGQVEAWKKSGGSWSNVGTNQTAYASANNCACAIDGNGYIDVAYYSSPTALSFVQFNTATNTWGTPSTIAAITSGGTYYCCAIAVDFRNCSHIAFNSYNGTVSALYYINNTGGSWQSVVTVSSSSLYVIFPDIAIDTMNSTGHRYNTPQITAIMNNGNLSFFVGGNGSANNSNNNPSSFTSITTGVATGNNPPSIIIDSSGTTTVILGTNYTYKTEGYYCAGSTAWTSGFSTLEDVQNNTVTNCAAAAVSGTTRYCFAFYTSTNGIYSISSTTYGTWGTPTEIEGNPPCSATGTISVLWSYANMQPYSTYGIDYLFTVGTGAGNLYYDNLGTMITVPPHNGNLLQMFR
ncbi:MAG: hypothetical protein WB560_08625 [Desulfobaccales bacterium]